MLKYVLYIIFLSYSLRAFGISDTLKVEGKGSLVPLRIHIIANKDATYELEMTSENSFTKNFELKVDSENKEIFRLNTNDKKEVLQLLEPFGYRIYDSLDYSNTEMLDQFDRNDSLGVFINKIWKNNEHSLLLVSIQRHHDENPDRTIFLNKYIPHVIISLFVVIVSLLFFVIRKNKKQKSFDYIRTILRWIKSILKNFKQTTNANETPETMDSSDWLSIVKTQYLVDKKIESFSESQQNILADFWNEFGKSIQEIESIRNSKNAEHVKELPKEIIDEHLKIIEEKDSIIHELQLKNESLIKEKKLFSDNYNLQEQKIEKLKTKLSEIEGISKTFGVESSKRIEELKKKEETIKLLAIEKEEKLDCSKKLEAELNEYKYNNKIYFENANKMFVAPLKNYFDSNEPSYPDDKNAKERLFESIVTMAFHYDSLVKVRVEIGTQHDINNVEFIQNYFSTDKTKLKAKIIDNSPSLADDTGLLVMYITELLKENNIKSLDVNLKGFVIRR